MARLYTTDQAADYIGGIKKRMVQHLCKTGKLTAHKVGRDWLIFHEDLDRYIKSRRPRKKIVES